MAHRGINGFTRWCRLCLILVLTSACGNVTHDPHLQAVDSMADEDPAAAIAMLDSIDKASLSKYNRRYYDLLRIKTSDKAYVRHTSDSLYRSVLAFFENKKDDPLYPDVLYYGGRVYADIGDYPRALQHYQNCLDNINKKNNLTDLKTRALSQLCKLYVNLRLYPQAIESLKQSISINIQNNDSINLLKNLQLMGSVFLRAGEKDSALMYFNKTLNCKNASYNQSQLLALTKIYVAHLLYDKGNTDSALNLIEANIDKVNPISRNTALTYAIDIYKGTGNKEKAFVFLKELIESNNHVNKRFGYAGLLSDGFDEGLGRDSLLNLIKTYKDLLENDFKNNEAKLALIQESYYNYRLHEREYKKVDRKNRQLIAGICLCLIIILILISINLYLKNQNHKKKIRLIASLKRLEELNSLLISFRQDDNLLCDNNPGNEMNEISWLGKLTNASIDEIRSELREKYNNLYKKLEGKIILPRGIIISQQYKLLLEYIDQGKQIQDKDPLWKDLKNLVISYFPDFENNFRLLTAGKLTKDELDTAYLIKLDINPTNIGKLLGRSRSAINSRRAKICEKIFDEKKSTRVIDSIIKIL